MGVSFLAIAAACIGILPIDGTIREDVDLIELNHYYDASGKLVFDQVIFYDWSPADSRFQVRAWRLLKAMDQLPQKNWKNGTYAVSWHDGDVLREVRADSYRETWTQHDPELAEREYLPKEKRRDLVRATDVIRR